MTQPLSTQECDALKARLAEALAAYHALLIGGGTQSVTFGPGKSVSYTAANAGELRRYIDELRARIAACCGGAIAESGSARAPIRFGF